MKGGGGRKQQRLDENLVVSVDDKVEPADLEAVYDALRQLDDEQLVEILILRFWFGMTIKQIAEQMGMTEEMVKYRIEKAIIILRDELG